MYCALIGYIYYEAPEAEQNFSTLLEFINASETREEDEELAWDCHLQITVSRQLHLRNIS